MMLQNFDKHLTPSMKERIAKKNMSIYQFVTLASLIEKEAKFEPDRPLIASVFENRLRIHMKLQSDASIAYAMGNHKVEYSISETQYDSPYNTYVYEDCRRDDRKSGPSQHGSHLRRADDELSLLRRR